ncbi:MAG TPA: AI-2E family transporter [Solirubrobacterales bacterium]
MDAAGIQARAVAKVAIVALAMIAAALLLALIVLHTRTTLQWVVIAVFFALGIAPLVSLVERVKVRGRGLPRWLAILVVYLVGFLFFLFVLLQVIPPMVKEVEKLASQLPTYIHDFEDWAEGNEEFRDLNDKYDITKTLTDEAKQLPSKIGSAAGEAGQLTVQAASNIFAAITILALGFFLVLDRGRLYANAVSRLPGSAAERWRRIGEGIFRVVKSYITVALLSAVMAGVFTWLMLELLDIPMAVPLAVLVAFLDLIPLIGFTLGGLLIAVVAGITDFPTAAIIWGIAFLVYQQLQDRVFQPLMFKSAVHLNPAVSIVAILVGAELLGILGALIAIPVAGSIGVVLAELVPREVESGEPVPAGAHQAEPATEPS